MMDTSPLEALVQTLKSQTQAARQLALKLPLLESGTGKQRNETLIALKTFFDGLTRESHTPLHALQSFIAYLHNPEYEDTLGRDFKTDLDHIQLELEDLRGDFRHLGLIHKAGTQPKSWIEAQFRNLNGLFNELSDFLIEVLEKVQ